MPSSKRTAGALPSVNQRMEILRSLIFALLLLAPLVFAEKPQFGTIVHLFEWRWNDVAKECENFLGKAGYAAVQISPPQEHVTGPQWWTRYQPVSYKLESRGGSRSELIDMVKRCKAVEVDIYADAVINHMTGVGSGVGVAGSQFFEYSYPAVPYSRDDFHFCNRPENDIGNYNDAFEVRNCELVNLADLKMESDYVQGKIADYLNSMIDIGIAGFRYDAAKHMHPTDLGAIRGKLSGDPYIFQEVIDQSDSEAIRASEYFGTGDVTEFKYGAELGKTIKTPGKMRFLHNFGEDWGLMKSNKAVVFLSNHDNERGHGGGGSVLTFGYGKLYELGSVFMLAWPYGYPKVMSSYDFDNDPDRGPLSASPYRDGKIICDFNEDWKCQHRWKPIAGMVQFRKVAGNSKVSKWWAKGDAIAFGRGDKAFVIINRNESKISETWSTDLPLGNYCNILHDVWENGKCSGPLVSVNGKSQISLSVAALKAAAFHVGAKE